jgi:integrase
MRFPVITVTHLSEGPAMPRRPPRIPSYRLHKPSGQAVVTLSGRDHYLGPHGTDSSRAEYDRLVGQWQAGGRVPLGRGKGDLTVSELMLAYWKHAEVYYRKGGEPTTQQSVIRQALRPLRELYGKTAVAEFGPLALIAVRQRFIDRGLSRKVINGHVDRIRLMFRWGVEQEMIAESVYSALKAVRSLPKGRTEAPDHPAVGPAPMERVRAAQKFMRLPVAAMVDLQLLTGMRPGEVCLMRARDMDRSGDVWIYTPHSHKTEHRGKERPIPIGPRAQEVLALWLERFPDGYLFRPRGWGTPKPRGKVKPVGDHYQVRSYRAAVYGACDRAFPHPTLSGIAAEDLTPEQREKLEEWRRAHRWHPNQLRHNAATEIRRRFDLDAARTVLGHSDLKTSEVYALRDLGRALEVARTIG